MAEAPAQPDPVSWLMIEPGWHVLASGGQEVGEVSLIAGDSTDDIFNGLAVSASALGQPKYVPAEQVARISQGEVRLSIAADAFAQLGHYEEPATSGRIGGEAKKGFIASVGADAREVGQSLSGGIDHEQKMSIWRRLGLFFKRK
jgi:hypothetical protein